MSGCDEGVVGPADVIPANINSEWLDDWLERAKRSLGTAYDDAKKQAEDIRDKAKKIAENVKTGAQAISSIPSQVVSTARDALERIIAIAERISWSVTIASGAVTVGVLIGLLLLMPRIIDTVRTVATK